MNKNNCKNCFFFDTKNKKLWCIAPEVQEIKRQDLLVIKEEEIETRYCEYFKIKD